jgi:death on curing protein
VERFGGIHGVRDSNVIESAVMRPQNLWGVIVPKDIADLGAAYLVSLARQQGFLDGNKRTALAAALTFLHANGYDLDRPFDEVFAMILATATNRVLENQVGAWIRLHMIKRPSK